MISSCREAGQSPYKDITLDTFTDLYESGLRLNSHEVRRCIDKIMSEETFICEADRSTQAYYNKRSPFIWIYRAGVSFRADRALHFLRKAAECGLDTNKLRLKEIAADILMLRNLNFHDSGKSINKTMARVEYNLTRAYLRYVTGQRFGFVNPDRLLNSIEKSDSDTISGHVRYRQFSDLKIERPNKKFYETAIHKAFTDSIKDFFAYIQPNNNYYKALITLLHKTPKSSTQRIKILCNIERSRWHQREYKFFSEYKKYVIVNIPSYSLFAMNEERQMFMRVAVGSTEHKTPLLTSSITRMDINPQWIIPKSIARGIIGRTSYMRSQDIFVLDKKKGNMSPTSVSFVKIMNGEQYLVQAGGYKNPLGRIIFRFNNNFSVYLHDTSSPWLFQRTVRALSHGCVRVEKPLELAFFMLDNKDEKLFDNIRYSMTIPFSESSDPEIQTHIDKKRLVNSVKLKGNVPIFLTYYTIFYDNNGKLVFYNDIYGYDKVIARNISSFI